MAEKMVDLKLSEKEREEEYGINSVPQSTKNLPKYPYWTEIRLGVEEVKKLGLSDVKGDDKMHLEAVIKIKELRFKDTGKGNEIESCTIQIQKMKICSQEDENKKMRNEVEKEVYS